MSASPRLPQRDMYPLRGRQTTRRRRRRAGRGRRSSGTRLPLVRPHTTCDSSALADTTQRTRVADTAYCPSLHRLRYLSAGLEVREEVVNQLRNDELRRVLAQRKLLLILDLDHTLLNSARITDVRADNQR